MKKLKDLKDEFLNDKFNNFYVFYGEDFGLRKHYINAVKQKYKRVIVLDNYEDISNNKGSALIVTKTLFIIYECKDFCDLSTDKIKHFMRKIGDDCVIFDFEVAYEKSNLFKDFSDYITYFPLVNEKIGQEFVKSEVIVSQKSTEDIAYNCYNDYNEIVLETDKIKSLANEKQINSQQAYEILLCNKQLNLRVAEYDNDLIVNDLLTYNFKQFSYWEDLLNKSYTQEFWYNLIRTTNDYLIAYYLKQYGKWDGGKKAYEYGLSWSRIKVIRELRLPYDSKTYLYFAYELSEIDYKVKTGVIKPEDVYNYFVYTIL